MIELRLQFVAAEGPGGEKTEEPTAKKKEDTRKDMVTGAVEKTGLPTSNVLYYELSDQAWCCVRPSGTEPKIKYYFGVKGNSLEDAETKLAALKEDLLK